MSNDASDPYGDYSKFYDLYVGDKSDDIPFYLKYAQEARTPILEIGAGTGRLTIPFARAGHSVVAVDISPSMLANREEQLFSNWRLGPGTVHFVPLPEPLHAFGNRKVCG